MSSSARVVPPDVAALSSDAFRLLVESVEDYAIFMLDSGGHVATWNAGAEKAKGYSADEIVGRHFSAFYTPEDRDAGRPARILEAVRRDGRCEDEGWRVRKDGSRFWANVVVTALRDDSGALLGYAKVTRDLTARREAEEVQRRLVHEQAARSAAEQSERRLAESEERYRALSQRLEVILDGVEDGITVQDASGQLVFANTAAARLCGFESVQELVTTPPTEIFARFEMLDENGQPFDFNQLPGRRVLRGEEGGQVTIQVRERGTGRDWWSLIRARPVRGSDGRPELAVNILHDVTEARRDEQRARYLAAATAALGASLDVPAMLSELARALVPGIGEWCAVHLLDGERLYAAAFAGTEPGGTLAATERVARTGVPLTSAFELLVPLRLRDHIFGTLALGSRTAGRYRDDDGLLLEEIGRRAAGALENAQLYRAAQDAAARAEAASRLKDEFLATVSHELRTPLNAIVGWAGLLRERALDPAFARGIEVIDRNAQAQVKIIDDILDVSRIIAGKLRLEPMPVDLVTIANEAMEVVRPSAAAKGISLHLEASPQFCVLLGDPERLQQVVWNLLSNAVKFSEKGGVIRIAVRSKESSAVLTVADEGRGIEPEFLPFVFDRFRQADGSTTRRIGGLGLGLALVRHIVELHGGTVSAASEGPGKGAEFTLELPVRRSLSAGEDRRLPSARGPDAHTLDGVRVLIVDDDEDARELMAEVLTQAGAVTETAPSAAAGFDALARFHPHVLISDIAMPEEDGYAFMQRVRAMPAPELASLPSLALTAHARREDRARALAKGFTTHVGKPINPRDLVAAVASLAGFARPTARTRS